MLESGTTSKLLMLGRVLIKSAEKQPSGPRRQMSGIGAIVLQNSG